MLNNLNGRLSEVASLPSDSCLMIRCRAMLHAGKERVFSEETRSAMPAMRGNTSPSKRFHRLGSQNVIMKYRSTGEILGAGVSGAILRGIDEHGTQALMKSASHTVWAPEPVIGQVSCELLCFVQLDPTWLVLLFMIPSNLDVRVSWGIPYPEVLTGGDEDLESWQLYKNIGENGQALLPRGGATFTGEKSSHRRAFGRI